MQAGSARLSAGGARPFRWLIPAAALLLALGCGGSQQPASSGAKANPEAGETAGATEHSNPNDWFVDQARQAGINFSYFNGMSGEFSFPEMLPGGVALFDYDNDGDLDVFLTQGDMLGEGRTPA